MLTFGLLLTILIEQPKRRIRESYRSGGGAYHLTSWSVHWLDVKYCSPQVEVGPSGSLRVL